MTYAFSLLLLSERPLHSRLLLYCISQHFNKKWIRIKIVNEYYQEIPQSQTADKPMALRERATQKSRDTRKTY